MKNRNIGTLTTNQLATSIIQPFSLNPNKRLYFASDFHLGAPTHKKSLERERKIVHWLDTIKTDAEAIFLVGDLFDFWYEYGSTVPAGYVRFLGKLAELRDAGIQIYVFAGNHDLWYKNYFTHELGIPVFHKPITLHCATAHKSTRFYVGHGDGLGPGDRGFKLLKKIFTNPLAIWAFGWLHPRVGMGLASLWSDARKTEENLQKSKIHLGQKEWLFQYAQSVEKHTPHNYYVFGHRHLPMRMEVSPTAEYINLGEWLSDYTYAVFDGKTLKLECFEA